MQLDFRCLMLVICITLERYTARQRMLHAVPDARLAPVDGTGRRLAYYCGGYVWPAGPVWV